jgi:WD40 repeat protein
LPTTDAGPCVAIDLESGAERVLSGVAAGPGWAAYSRDRRLFAAPRNDVTGVWETPDFRPLARLEGMLRSMNGVAFSPEGRRLAVASSGSEGVRLWDVASWDSVLTLEATGWQLGAMRFSPNGDMLAALTQFGQLHLWRAPPWEKIDEVEWAAKSRAPRSPGQASQRP